MERLGGEESDSAPPTLWHTISDVLEVEEMTELGKAVYER